MGRMNLKVDKTARITNARVHQGLGEMVQIQDGAGGFPSLKSQQRFYQNPLLLNTFFIKQVQINWPRLMAKRETVLATVGAMPTCLLKPGILRLLGAEKHTACRLILDIIWFIGARTSEVLALRPSQVNGLS